MPSSRTRYPFPCLAAHGIEAEELCTVAEPMSSLSSCGRRDACRCHSQPHRFVQMLRILRRKGLVAEFVSVYLHHVQRAVYIATDGGRVGTTNP